MRASRSAGSPARHADGAIRHVPIAHQYPACATISPTRSSRAPQHAEPRACARRRARADRDGPPHAARSRCTVRPAPLSGSRSASVKLSARCGAQPPPVVRSNARASRRRAPGTSAGAETSRTRPRQPPVVELRGLPVAACTAARTRSSAIPRARTRWRRAPHACAPLAALGRAGRAGRGAARTRARERVCQPPQRAEQRAANAHHQPPAWARRDPAGSGGQPQAGRGGAGGGARGPPPDRAEEGGAAAAAERVAAAPAAPAPPGQVQCTTTRGGGAGAPWSSSSSEKPPARRLKRANAALLGGQGVSTGSAPPSRRPEPRGVRARVDARHVGALSHRPRRCSRPRRRRAARAAAAPRAPAPSRRARAPADELRGEPRQRARDARRAGANLQEQADEGHADADAAAALVQHILRPFLVCRSRIRTAVEPGRSMAEAAGRGAPPARAALRLRPRPRGRGRARRGRGGLVPVRRRPRLARANPVNAAIAAPPAARGRPRRAGRDDELAAARRPGAVRDELLGIDGAADGVDARPRRPQRAAASATASKGTWRVLRDEYRVAARRVRDRRPTRASSSRGSAPRRCG